MLGSKFSHSLEVNLTTCRAHLKQEFFCETAVLNIGKDLLHSLLCILCNDLRAGDVIAVLSRVGDRISHARKAGLINQVYNQFHLMDTLKVSVSGIIASLAKGFKTSLHQCANTAAKNCLLTKEVCFRFGSESGFQNACARAANACCISKRLIQSMTGVILLNGNKTRRAFAFLELAANRVAGSLGRDHGNIHIFRRNDAAEMNVEAMSKHKHIALFKVRLNILFINISLQFIIDQEHNDIRLLNRLCGCINFKALRLCFFP